MWELRLRDDLRRSGEELDDDCRLFLSRLRRRDLRDGDEELSES